MFFLQQLHTQAAVLMVAPVAAPKATPTIRPLTIATPRLKNPAAAKTANAAKIRSPATKKANPATPKRAAIKRANPAAVNAVAIRNAPRIKRTVVTKPVVRVPSAAVVKIANVTKALPAIRELSPATPRRAATKKASLAIKKANPAAAHVAAIKRKLE